MRIIDVIGFSGSGKTYFIMKAIKLFKLQLGYNVTVIKNVKHHEIDERGKDSHIFTNSGASYSIIQNLNNEMAIFLKAEENGFDKLIKWLEQGPYKIDIVFTEGFRDLNHPTVLCVNTIDEIKKQITNTVKMISGSISEKREVDNIPFNIPIINIEENFEEFLKIFKIP
jgi:molybdopterin-guanine dinucleotide biosynthesis protein MobB